MMTIKNIITRCFVTFGILLVFTNSIADNNQVVMRGVYDNSNIQAGYIVANDMKFSVDNATRIYDASGNLRSIKSLKQGHHLVMTYRKQGIKAKNVSEMILDKIIYSSN